MPSRAAPRREPRDLRSQRSSLPEEWAETASLRGQRSSRSSQATSQAGRENHVGAAQWRNRPGSAGTARAPPMVRRMPGRSASAPFQDLTASAMNEINVAVPVASHDIKKDAADVSDIAEAEVAVADASLFVAESSNVQSVAEYATEIFDLLFQKEILYQPRANYMELQTDINGRMRAILVDWLVEVHMKYKLRPETLFLTVNILDRYLSLAPVARRYLQLHGVVSMLVAAKFEEITPPEVRDFVYITDNAYTAREIMDGECKVLTALEFQVVAPTPVNFAQRFQRINQCDGKHCELAQYLVELALLDDSMLRHTPSLLAAAAVLLSNRLLGRHPVWPAVMARQTRYGEGDLAACVEDLRVRLQGAPENQHQAVCKKYARPEHQCVARMTFGAP